MDFNPTQIEQKWQNKWSQAKLFATDLDTAKKPYFSHVMFPYPS